MPHAASAMAASTIQTYDRNRFMTMLLLEALGAGLILVGIIWWTMFSGRKNGELPGTDTAEPDPSLQAKPLDKNKH